MSKKQFYQTVIIEFSNGFTGYYTGPAQFTKEASAGVTILDIKFTEPKEMPAGYLLETMQEKKEKDEQKNPGV